MFTFLQFIFKTIPGHMWRNWLRGILTTACVFYVLSLSEFAMLDRYISLLINHLFWRYVLLYLVIYSLFYGVLDVLLRLLVFKLIRDKFLKLVDEENGASRISYLREINQVKNGLISFVLGTTVKLGYATTSDFKELISDEPIVVTDQEKEKAICEIIMSINKWICIMIHILFTMALVWNFDRILALILFLVVLILTFLLYAGIILMIQNIDKILIIIQKEIRKLK